jgi:glucan phosphoethanolaminetransferase (alkaline phosphatase superfamily)
MKHKLVQKVASHWQSYAKTDKIRLVYIIVLLLALIFLPVLRLDYLNSAQVDTFTFLSGAMYKTAIIMFLSTLFLLFWSVSVRFKKRIHELFGFTWNDTLISCAVLFLLVAILFGMGETVSIIKQNFSYRVSTTIRYLVLWLYLVGGLIAHLIVARLNHKKQSNLHDVTYAQHTHTQKEQAAFHHVKQEFWGLFNDDEMRR